MALTLYITATEPFSGKTAFCVGLLRRFQRDGYTVGYMKPVGTRARVVGGRVIDKDAHFIKYSLGLPDSLDQMAPIQLDATQLRAALTGASPDFTAKLQAAFAAVSAGKEIMVLEGAGHFREGRVLGLAPGAVAKLLQSRQLVVVPYDNDLQATDDLLVIKRWLGDSLVGGVINQVPPERREAVVNRIKPFVERQGVPLFAVLPQVETLKFVSVIGLSRELDGQILCAHHVVDTLVEHVMVGAMDSARAFDYFRRTPNKAVITSGDRIDLQLSALETSTRCLILTNNIQPSPMILDRAETANIPIILTAHDTFNVIELAERYLGRHRFHREENVQRFDSLLSEFMDFDGLYRTLELSPVI